ncbi:nucleoside 2-deoxyribosyltransferase [Gracilibacillus alcaliphilus]|nr:nucleoside 2-deoxyribosyltransferase [Gracilibacillus alcaliphilus]
MKTFYVASSFKNIDKVREVSHSMKRKRFIQTYDWTLHSRAATVADLQAIGHAEKEAVTEADIIIVILPAGKGSHIELGMAIAQGKQIYLYDTDQQVNNMASTSTFYHLPDITLVTGSVDQLIEKVINDD